MRIMLTSGTFLPIFLFFFNSILCLISIQVYCQIKFLFRSLQVCGATVSKLMMRNANPTKMVNHTQTIRRQTTNEMFECV